VLGLAAGNAAGRGDRGRVGAETQTFVTSCEAWLDHGWRAPEALAELFARRLPGFRAPGRALRMAVERRRHGAPWYDAASRSYGNGALCRAAAVAIVRAADTASIGEAASLDAAVTHASRRATASSAALAGIVVALVQRDASTPAAAVVAEVVRSSDHEGVRSRLESALDARSIEDVIQRIGDWPHATSTLGLALWCALEHSDPVEAIAVAARGSAHGDTVAAVAGALVGVIHGVSALPAGWVDQVEGASAYRLLAERIVRAGAPLPPAEPITGPAIWFLLDRSGSMQAIADDVVTGFDRFFAEQRAAGGEATVTIVQFDGDDPHEVLVDARPLDAVRSIRSGFQPRGMTPLYDAIELLLDRAEARRGDPADQLVVILTDGEENASHRSDREQVFRRVAALRDAGWTFVFLGANQDSYAAGGAMGMHAGNVSNFYSDAPGVDAAYSGLSRTVTAWRRKPQAARLRDRDDFWGGVKEAEER
jgi:ADP-ribosylglycohydrolase